MITVKQLKLCVSFRYRNVPNRIIMNNNIIIRVCCSQITNKRIISLTIEVTNHIL